MDGFEDDLTLIALCVSTQEVVDTIVAHKEHDRSLAQMVTPALNSQQHCKRPGLKDQGLRTSINKVGRH